MPAYSTHRLYATIKATPPLREAYNHSDRSIALVQLTDYARKLLRSPPYEGLASPALIKAGFKVVCAPSNDWQGNFVGDDKYSEGDLKRNPPEDVAPDALISIFQFADLGMLREFQQVVLQGHERDTQAPITGTGVDLGIEGADHWSPGTDSSDSFGVRVDAHRTVLASALAHSGRNANIVIIDQGLHRASIPDRNWGGGLSRLPQPPALPVPPGSALRTSHGMMMARTILALAPDAVLYDVPLIPRDRIANVPLFTGLAVAHAAFAKLLVEIWLRRLLNPSPQFQGPWIFVNAWAIFDRATETAVSPGDYTENKNPFPGGHPLIALIRDFVIGANLFDVVFAAGNCGVFDASPRCGERDRGPGHSIWGANALAEVITAGAVSSAETWIGYSSQGPGPAPKLAALKPDLCAPSNFRDDHDAALTNSGTSTACAMTAGVVAALRSNPKWNQFLVPPSQMHAALTTGSRKTLWAVWNERLGHGVLDAQGAIRHLP